MSQPVTIDQLARLYQARNAANKRMGQALRGKDKTLIKLAKDDATRWNQAYDAALKAWNKQQKKARRDQWRTTMIKFYIDHHEAT